MDLVPNQFVEDPEVVDAEPILRAGQPPKALDAALAEFRRLVPQVELHRVAHIDSIARTKAAEIRDRLGGENDLESHSG
jgi:hypothetical protein